MRDPGFNGSFPLLPTASSAAATGIEAATTKAAKFRYLREYWRPSVLASQRVYGLSLLS